MPISPPNPLEEVFSSARFAPYRRSGESFADSFRRYQWNVRLSEAMMPSLHYLEVCLRNRLDILIRRHFGNNWLLTPPAALALKPDTLRKIADAEGYFRLDYGRAPTQDDIVAQMSFGFWHAFFHKRYDPILWQRHQAILSVFPNLQRIQRTRKFIEPQLMDIKELRNRIAHHEPIWNMRPSVPDIHGKCMTLIGAMSAEALAELQRIDRISSVWSNP